MQSSSTLPPRILVLEALGIGVLVGLMHGLAESTLLGLNGIRPTAVDLVILVTVPLGISAMAAVLIGAGVSLPPLRSFFAKPGGPMAYRRLAWSLLVGGYFLVFIKIIPNSGWGAALKSSLPALVVLAIAAVAVFRSGQRVLVLVFATGLAASTLCALHLAYADWVHELPPPAVFWTRLLLPAALCLLGLVIATRTVARNDTWQPVQRGAFSVALLLAVWAAAWAFVVSGFSPRSLLNDGSVRAASSRPNILLIVLDTVRAHHLDLFGYERETMPNLKRFAVEKCQIVNRMVTTSSWTLPAHGSMFTGLYPSAHGAHFPFDTHDSPDLLAYSLREDIPTLAEFLGTVGYRTASIAGNYVVLSQFGLTQGFQDLFVDPGSAYFAGKLLWLHRLRISHWRAPGMFLMQNLPRSVQAGSRLFSSLEPHYRRARQIRETAQRWMDENRDQPFFVFVNFFDAHIPYTPILEDDERFAKRPPGAEWFSFPTGRMFAAYEGKGKFTNEELEFLKAQYDAELVSLDRELSKLFDYLEQSGSFENTLIFVTTDHGEAFLEQGFLSHGNSVYDSEIGGFLLVKAPPSVGPVQASPWMQHVDFLPTIASILDEPPPPNLQGSVWGQGRGYALSELFCRPCAKGSRRELPEKHSRDLIGIVVDDHKLIRSTRAPDEVYNLTTDPGESNPILDPDPGFMQRANQIISDRNARLIEGYVENSNDEALLEKLRGLGYVQ